MRHHHHHRLRRLGAQIVALTVALLPAVAVAETEIAPGAFLLPGRFVSGEQPDGNSVILHSEQGAIVFDAGRHPAHTQRLLDHLASRSVSQVVLVNSHWHLDHSSGLAALRKAFPEAPLYAADRGIRHVGSPFLAGYREQLVAALKSPDVEIPEDAEPRAELARIGSSIAFYPTHDVPRPRDVGLLGRAIHLGAANGVSGGDTWLRDDSTDLLLAGDLVTLPAPLFDTACLDVWADDLNVVSAMRFEILVPGHGRVLTRDEFRLWHEAFDNLHQCVDRGRPAETCRNGWLKDGRKLIAKEDREQASQLLDYYLAGPLTAAAQEKLCAGR